MVGENIHRFRYGVLSFVAVLIGVTLAPASVSALVGAHSYAGANGDVFLGNDYIEVGISKFGSFGTTAGVALPTGFYGTAARTNVGMSTNPSGFGESPDLRMDYFLPGSAEERWVVGYKVGGVETTGSNAFLRAQTDIADYTVANESTASLLKATGIGTLNSKLQVSQVVSFKVSDKFFENKITLKNVDSQAIDSVRYMRSFDPDNTQDQGGVYQTQNQILYTHQAGDGRAVVSASTANRPSDPVFLATGSRSPIIFYSADPQARVSTFGFSNTDPYAPLAYDSAAPKGGPINGDNAITIAFDVGSLAPGESKTVNYLTSLDNRDINDVLNDLEKASLGPNDGDGNGDGVQDSEQPGVMSQVNKDVAGGAYQTLEAKGCDTISSYAIKPADQLKSTSSLFNYPLGLSDFTINCATLGAKADITFFYDKEYDTSSWVAHKYKNGIFSSMSDAKFSTAMVGANKVTTLSYSIVDGGAYDDDGLANGVIVDPVGPAVVNTGSPNTGFMPKSQLLAAGSIVFGSVLVGLSFHRVYGRKQA